LQKEIMEKVEHQIASGLMMDADKDRATKARLRSIKKNASAWLLCIPTHSSLTLNDTTYRLAARLGLTPQDNLPSTCSCGADLLREPHHFLSCSQKTAGNPETQHDCLAQLLVKVGGSVYIEPNWFDGMRPDAQVSLLRNNTMLDVTVVHPSAPSYLVTAAASELGAATKREKEKIKKYSDLARQESCTFVPIVLETFGAFGTMTSGFLKQALSDLRESQPSSSPSLS